jgi:uncharacterized UPF0146 family protein
MTPGFVKILKGIFAIVIANVCVAANTASAQNTPKSRVAVVANDSKTNIWVSDFPKETSIVIYDTENNLISITSTNKFGAAFLSLPKGVKTGVIVKTIDGEISATNKSVVKYKQEEQNVVAAYQDDENKA